MKKNTANLYNDSCIILDLKTLWKNLQWTKLQNEAGRMGLAGSFPKLCVFHWIFGFSGAGSTSKVIGSLDDSLSHYNDEPIPWSNHYSLYCLVAITSNASMQLVKPHIP